jgi:NAD(P)-dependent dehydrogenase (short-subunit alcohol dehydrogenase family)
MSNRLLGKGIIITGGTSGIGEDAVYRCLKEGAHVVFTGRDKKRADAVLKHAKKISQHVKFFKQDVTNEEDWINLAKYSQKFLPNIDGLLNNAGTFVVGPIEDLTLDSFESIMDLNVNSIFLGLKHILPIMRKNKKGVVLNNASLSGLVGHEHCVAYCTSKAAAIQLGNVAALEAAKDKVRVLSLAPGPVWNSMLADRFGDNPETKQYFIDTQPYKELCVPKHVSDAIVFFMSDQARYITGTAVKIDCGRGAD